MEQRDEDILRRSVDTEFQRLELKNKKLRSALKAKEEENAALKLLIEGKDELLAAYRVGRNPKNSTWKKIEAANKALGRAA